MSAQDLISRLEHCRQSGRDTWIARCPAHQDRSPSLSITEKEDGRVLVHCHAGCGALDVITAVGLDWDALYPDDGRCYRAERTQREQSIDELVLEIAKADRAAGKPLSVEDQDRELEAFARLQLNDPTPEDDLQPMMMATANRYAQEAGQ